MSKENKKFIFNNQVISASPNIITRTINPDGTLEKKVSVVVIDQNQNEIAAYRESSSVPGQWSREIFNFSTREHMHKEGGSKYPNPPILLPGAFEYIIGDIHCSVTVRLANAAIKNVMTTLGINVEEKDIKLVKNVYIIHGWDGSPSEPMHQWMQSELTKMSFSVKVPEMPDPAVPKIEPWVNKLKEVVDINEETILIGHSIGCQAVLRFLEVLPDHLKIKGIVLIAPWMQLDMKTMEEEGQKGIEIAKPWMETKINFEKIKTHVSKVVAIFSDNDPYVPLINKDLFKRELNAEIIIENNKGHFTIGDDVRELPPVLKAVLKF